MTRLTKVFLIAVVVLASLSLFAFIFLFHDDPYPQVDAKGLMVTASEYIPEGISQSIPTLGGKNTVADGIWFKDPTGRTMIHHGINVSGSSKQPFTPRIGSYNPEGFYESAATCSFVGRPFPLEEADEHFSRLHRWGFRFIRLLVTWEAIEHAGPGVYDEEYLDYIKAIIEKAAEYRINVFVDPHQDVWSRFTGGDGAPLWTLDVVGFEPRNMHATGAALIHCFSDEPNPKMLWPTNHFKLGTATMFTVFFGSKDFAPSLMVGNETAQEFLQSHFINAYRQLAVKLKGMPNVIGFNTMNEPSPGYIGEKDISAEGIYLNGVMPTPFEGMVAGSGKPIEVPRYKFDLLGAEEIERVKLNPDGLSAWKSGSDIWRNAGVWDFDKAGSPVLNKPDHFTVVNGKKVDFGEDYYKPFLTRFVNEIRLVDTTWLFFVERDVRGNLPHLDQDVNRSIVHASHWYDLITLLTKEYVSWGNVNAKTRQPVLGRTAIRNHFREVVAEMKSETNQILGSRPTLVGEFGIPIDLADRKAYTDMDFIEQEAALDRTFQALEANQMSYTLWNYTPDNDNAHGDQWNGEDFSIYSKDQRLNNGTGDDAGRALRAVLRPYPYKVSGTPLEYYFEMDAARFYFKFHADQTISAPTEIFLPFFHFGSGFSVHSSPGRLEFDESQRLLLFYPSTGGENVLIVEGPGKSN